MVGKPAAGHQARPAAERDGQRRPPRSMGGKLAVDIERGRWLGAGSNP